MSLILGFAVTVAIWPREVVSCRDFILHTAATFWVMSLVGIYPGRASEIQQKHYSDLDETSPRKSTEGGKLYRLIMIKSMGKYLKGITTVRNLILLVLF